MKKKSKKTVKKTAEKEKAKVNKKTNRRMRAIKKLKPTVNMRKDSEVIRALGRLIVEPYYDFQGIRITNYNRLRDIIRKKNEGIKFNEVEEKKENKTFDKKYDDKNLNDLLEDMVDEEILTEQEKEYIDKIRTSLKNVRKIENEYKNLMMGYMNKEKIWYEWLEEIKGISSVLGANLIKNFGYCEKYDSISALWKHCGMHVVNGKAPRRRKGKEIEYNPKLKTFVWKIGDSFMKQRTEPYRGIYDTEKERQLKRGYKKGELKEKYGKPYKEEDMHISRGHAHARALRKMVKIFLQHYWVIGRQLKGLDTKPPFVHSKLKHKNYIEPPHIPAILKPFNPLKKPKKS